jgi:hypothetical protein
MVVLLASKPPGNRCRVQETAVPSNLAGQIAFDKLEPEVQPLIRLETKLSRNQEFRDTGSSQYLFEGPHKPIAFSVGSNADAEEIPNSFRGKMSYQNCPAS